jgi:hypothetical protein
VAFDDVDDFQDLVVKIAEEDHIAFEGKAAEVGPQFDRGRPSVLGRRAKFARTVFRRLPQIV